MKKLIISLKIQQYEDENPSGEYVEYRCAIHPSVMEDVFLANKLGASISSWVQTAKQSFEWNPKDQFGMESINRQATVNNIRKLMIGIDSGKNHCSEVAMITNEEEKQVTYYFTVKHNE